MQFSILGKRQGQGKGMKVYRFSVQMEHAEQCEDWYEWFNKKNIPAAIIERSYMVNNTPVSRFSVWREGIDHNGGYESPVWSLGGYRRRSTIIKSCHEFNVGDN